MTQTIKLCLTDDNGNRLELPRKGANDRVRSEIEIKIADTFTEINVRINNLADAEMQTAEKFNFALELDKYLSEFRRIYEMEEITNAD